MNAGNSPGARRTGVVFEPGLAATGVGSLPHLEVGEAVAEVLEFCPDYPYWPQLPRLSGTEDMYRQFSAHLPGVVEEGGPRLIWRRDAEAARALERVYADTLALDETPDRLEAWRVDPAAAQGLYRLADVLTDPAAGEGARPRVKGLKGQITGPISLGLAVTDPDGRALLYEEDLMDGVVRGLALRGRWQQRFLAKLLEQGRPAGRGKGTAGSAAAEDQPRTGVVLLSVDEPYLGTFGSAYFPYRPETVLSYLRILDETLDGPWGVHCCANTDWEFLLGSPVRFVSFDAYAYGERLVLYPEAVRRFLSEGKTLLWGIVPTAADELAASDAPGLTRRLLGLFESLVARGVPETVLARQSMVTPACGLAGFSPAGSRRAMSLAAQVAKAAREALDLG